MFHGETGNVTTISKMKNNIKNKIKHKTKNNMIHYMICIEYMT